MAAVEELTRSYQTNSHIFGFLSLVQYLSRYFAQGGWGWREANAKHQNLRGGGASEE